MSINSLIRDWQRRQRIKHPEKKDYCSYMLIGIMGAEWWCEHGFEREYPEGRCLIDLANPRIKLAIEGDGEAYHFDLDRDQRRDDFLQSRGWYVLRFRYPELAAQAPKVRAKILKTYRDFAEPTPAQIRATRAQMRRSGF